MLSFVAAVLIGIQSLLPGSLLVAKTQAQLSSQSAEEHEATQPRALVISSEYVALPSANSELKLTQDNRAAMLYDNTASTSLYEKNINQRLPIASITKVMTALVILQHHSLDETVTIPNLAAQPIGSQAMGIKAGEQFKLSEAMTGMLTYSANDMAQALAIWDSGSEQAFVAKMNQQADYWGLKDTQFIDATGLGSGESYSSARDLVELAKIDLRSNFFRRATSQPRYSVSTLSGKRYIVTTTNQLLGTNGVVGTKTGYTLAAGQCLLSLTQRDGHEIIGVILGSSDRFGQTKAMLNAGFANYRWE